MTKKALYIRHKAKPGQRDDVREVWDRYARAYIENAAGQIVYVYGYDDADPDAIVAYQFYSGQAGADDFVNQPWFSDYERETADLLAGPSEFRSITPLWVKV
jgi:quinol monooxygenase YgiN